MRINIFSLYIFSFRPSVQLQKNFIDTLLEVKKTIPFRGPHSEISHYPALIKHIALWDEWARISTTYKRDQKSRMKVLIQWVEDYKWIYFIV